MTPLLLQPQGFLEEDAEERDEERRTDLDGWKEGVGPGEVLVCHPPLGLAGIGRHGSWRWQWRRVVAGERRRGEDYLLTEIGRASCRERVSFVV